VSALTVSPIRSSRLDAATIVRLVCLVCALTAFVAVFGLPRRIAQGCGWQLGRKAPVLFQRLICAGLGITVRRPGALCSGRGQLIVANHVSWLDIPVLGSLGLMSFLAKKEIGDHLLGRELVAMQGVIYVDRGRRSCIPAVNAGMAEAMRAGSPVVLFAEATTGDGNRLLRFRSSHFEAVRLAASGPDPKCALIQPIYVDYSRLAGLPMSRGQRPRVAWYGDMTFLRHFFQFVRSGGVTCDVYIGPPIRVLPSFDRKSVARLAEASVRALAAGARARPAPPVFLAPEKAYIGSMSGETVVDRIHHV
jgi:1-acyl-sn-glycerol-3-phosphate acyltransferase